MQVLGILFLEGFEQSKKSSLRKMLVRMPVLYQQKILQRPPSTLITLLDQRKLATSIYTQLSSPFTKSDTCIAIRLLGGLLLLYRMYSGTRITRQQFANTRFLKITVADFQKNYLHHSRFVFEVITDRSKQSVKKKYNEVKRFSDEIYQKFGMKELAIMDHLRNSKREEEVQNLFKRLNTGYLMRETNGELSLVKAQIRNYLYNLLFSSIEHLPSSDEDDHSATQAESQSFSSPQRQKAEEVKQAKEDRVKQGKFPNVIRNIFKSKRDSQDLGKKEQLMKSIKSIWLKTEKGWQEKILFAVTEDSLITHERGQPQFKHYILLKYLTAQLKVGEFMYINLHHPLLKRNVEIRINSPVQARKDLPEEYANLLAVLRQACDKGQREVSNFVGVFLSNKKNKFMVEPQKRPAQRLNLRLVHQEETYQIALPIDSSAYLELPVLNNYGKYDLQIIQQKEAGIIPNLRENAITITLPIQNIYDQIYNEKPKRKNPDMRNHILQSKQCNYALRFDYFQLTSWRSYCTGSVKDRFEGFEKPVEFSRDELRIQKNRMKRILYSSEQFFSYVGALKNWEYPLQSSIFYVLLFLSVIFFDANCILQYLLAIACVVMAYLHPAFYNYAKDFASLAISNNLAKVLSGKLGEKIWQPRFKIAFKKGEEKRKFLEEFNMRKKKKRNILEKYNRLQEILVRGQLYLTEFVTVSEKIKNLFCWYHHKKTKWLFLVFLTAFFALFFLPLRFLAFLAVVKMCAGGKERYSRIQRQNKDIVMEVMRIVIEEEELVNMRDYLDNPLKIIDKKTGEYNTFEKKIKQNLGSILQIQFEPTIFSEGRCIAELLDFLSQCRERFIIPQEFCRKYKLNPSWSANSNTLQQFLLAIYLLLTSVPSDRNILDTKPTQEQLKEEDSDEEDIS